MTQFAWRVQSATVEIVPGEVRTYRLPTTMPGQLAVTATRQFGPPPQQPGGHPQPPGHAPGTPGDPGGGVPPPPPSPRPAPSVLGGPEGRPPTVVSRTRTGFVDLSGGLISAPADVPSTGPSQPGDIVTDLLHGDELVQSTLGQIHQATPSEGDNTWRLRVQLAPGSPVSETYKYEVVVGYTSILPVLTRRIPLGFFQQGFEDN